MLLRRLSRLDAPGLLGSVFALAWLIFLAFPAYAALVNHPPAAAAPQMLGLAAFIAVYIWFWLRIHESEVTRRALVACLSLTALATVMTVAGGGRWIYMFIYVVVIAGRGFPLPRAIAAVAAITVVVALLALIPPVDPISVLVITILVGMIGAMTILVTGLVRTNYELEAARDRIAHLAVADERARIARDLHDLLGHTLSVIVLKAELAARLMEADPGRAATETGEIERVAREALKEVREAVSGYRQPLLSTELERARDALEAAGIEAVVERPGAPLPVEVETVLAWAVREGVTNVVRHSGASRCTISVGCVDGAAELQVVDDGHPSSEPQAGSGLRGLSERVQARHGTLDAGPAREGGFRLAVSLPLRTGTA